uniref:SFRICE_031727 n=1 Tax=Spodoptera frugiperda TaxID=7108 RepID=A0A2H1VL19_SPOFR
MKICVVVSFIVISSISRAVSEECDACLKVEQCPAFKELSKGEQEDLQLKYPCSSSEDYELSNLFGFAPISTGEYVCCSDVQRSVRNRRNNYNNFGRQNNNYDDRNLGYNNYPNSQNPNGYGFRNNPSDNGWGSNEDNEYRNQGSPDYDGNGYNNQGSRNYFNNNNSPYVTASPFFPIRGQGRGGNSQRGQCPVTSLPPNPDTGCCGREASDSDRIIDRPKPPSYYDEGPRNNGNNYYGNTAWPYNRPQSRFIREAEDVPEVTIGNRIAGGRETELEQFPWTVLLEVTFDYGDKRQGYNCGGSLISSKYVLTAGHCIFDQGGKVVGVDIYLAEYDKRTFPRDCKNVLGEGQKCIENIVMKAEDVVLHPQYDDTQLTNDIALIRLQGNAPYTDYIRPICLPSIDIDSPDFSNLRLAVAGWGRNGRYRSNIKQSTIVNLVPQEKCIKFYPNLSRRQMCAAGYTGEDTCKGDSGGPLMTVYGGKYQVVGVVSGKRADSPCGTSVPSLYTNVYHYRDWIQSNMKN